MEMMAKKEVSADVVRITVEDTAVNHHSSGIPVLHPHRPGVAILWEHGETAN